MLSVQGLRVEIGGKTIVTGVTFQVRAGDKVGLEAGSAANAPRTISPLAAAASATSWALPPGKWW